MVVLRVVPAKLPDPTAHHLHLDHQRLEMLLAASGPSMKYEDLKVGMKVEDAIFSSPANTNGTGIVKKILKTRVHIDFYHHKVEVYDLQHLQFLKRARK